MAPDTHLLIVDDDEVSREVLTLLAEAEGFDVASAASGDEAVASLAHRIPAVILTDLQMPGLTGPPLAAELRRLCGPDTVLLAMSGSRPKQLSGFDGFLLKPFPMEDLAAALEARAAAPAETPRSAVILDTTVFDNLERQMGPERLRALFTMFLADAEKRLATMRQAIAERDDATYRRAAHAIKGGCGMVGASELHCLAAALEETGLDNGSLDSLSAFVQAVHRLERMLVERLP
jgi:CheY-like chemotaxis protein/HPt (histidine-containing phosphotransfer) domain-containing protein